MSTGKVIGYIVAGIFIFFGVIFLWSAFGSEVNSPGSRILTGIILAGIGMGIIAFVKFREPKPAQEIVQKIDLTGDISVQEIHCQSCGAELESEHISVKAGAIFVSCPYCGSDYQMVEEPKW
jgi:hypothetical protein